MVSIYNVNVKITELVAQKIAINTTDQGDGELGSQIWHEEWKNEENVLPHPMLGK